MNQQQAPIAKKETIEETLNQGEILTYEEFELTQEELIAYKELKSGETLKKVLCPPIFIEQRFRNIHNNNVEMSLKFNVDGQYVTEKLPMESLLKLGSVLASKGFPISNPNLASVLEYLIKQQSTVPLQEQYQEVGVIKNSNGELMIALSEAISKNVTGLVWNKENSVADVSVGGSYDKWLETIVAEVLGESQLEFMLAVAASAPIVGYYFQTRQDIDSLMLQLVGSSTTGKTTAAQLAISLFGPPIKGPKTLFQSFSGTENAIPRMLGGNYGVPFLLDELSLATSSDLTKLLYLFAESREKARLNEQSQFQERSVWSTTIIMTGEHAILDQTNRNLGLQVRIFEFAIDAWTKDAAHANKLKKVVKNNYGHAGIEYANYLAEDWSRIDKNVQKWITFFQQKMPASKEMDRVGEKYAIIMAGLDMLGTAINVPFHLDDVAEFILQNEERLLADRDSAEAFYQTVVQDVCASVTQFHFNNQMSYSPVVKGLITSPKTGGYYRVNYLKSAFSTLVQKQNISNESTLLTELKKKSYFVTESDRTTKRAIVQGEKVATYEFLIPVSDLKPWLQ
ncbi:DUF927 domain-containing protein [Sporosarcina sp. FSL K6-5500]|uniref:DUF927 domain-containing protein n=1 Tax=Sporosarcina sp. FSL K6-5500 TaxID=2921558 RepID=UPI0030FA8EB6